MSTFTAITSAFVRWSSVHGWDLAFPPNWNLEIEKSCSTWKTVIGIALFAQQAGNILNEPAILCWSKDKAFSSKTDQLIVLAQCALMIESQCHNIDHEWIKNIKSKCAVFDDLIFQQHNVCCHQLLISQKYFKLRQLPPYLVKTVTDEMMKHS